MSKNNILLRKLPQPKLIKLPNGRQFYARYQRVNRQTLYPTRVRIKRTYVRKIGPGRQRKQPAPKCQPAQTGSGYLDANNLMRGLNLAKRGENTEFGKAVIDDAVSLHLKAYKSIKNRLFGRKKRKQQHR